MKTNLKLSTRGFSLVEILIGMTITLMIVGAFINLFIKQNQAYSSESLRQEMSLNGRIALDEIQRQSMNAGTGLPGLFSSVQVYDGGPDEPDTVTFIYVPQVNIRLKFADSPPPNMHANTIHFSDDSEGDELVLGDILLVYDAVNFTMVQVSHILGPDHVNFVPPRSVYNTPEGLNAKYDPATAVITRVSVRSMTVDKSDPDRPELVMFRGDSTLGAVAMDIENLQVTIIFEDGDTASVANDEDADDTNDSMDLRAVIVKLEARSSRPDSRYQVGDQYYRQEFSSTIAPRNIIYGG
jgi:hypothetical protein